MSKKVFIGVGHGGKDSGAIGHGLKEKDIVLQVALELRRILVNHDITVKISRECDENDDINEEVREENSFSSNLCLDIHVNAGGGNGFEIYHHRLGGRSKILAQNIEKEVIGIGQNSRGCKTKLNSSGKDYFKFIRDTIGSAVIVECAFIDTYDIYCIDELHEQKNFAKAIAKGVLKTLNIAYKEEESNNNNNSNSSSRDRFYRVIVGSYKERSNANNKVDELKSRGYNPFLANKNGYMRVVVGSYKSKNNAKKLRSELINKGYRDTFIVGFNK